MRDFRRLKSALRATAVATKSASADWGDRRQCLTGMAEALASSNPRRRVSWRVSALSRDFNPGISRAGNPARAAIKKGQSMPRTIQRYLARPAAALSIALTLGVAACGGSTPTATPAPTATATPAPTATSTPRPTASTAAANGTATRASGSPSAGATPNPVAVTSAYANLQKLDSYHLEIKADGVGTLIPLGIGNTLTYVIDANGGNQKIVIDDGTGTKQEGYKVGGKTYLVQNGQVTEATSLPLLFTLPDLLYNAVTAPGVMTFTAAGSEQVNGRATTKYNG